MTLVFCSETCRTSSQSNLPDAVVWAGSQTTNTIETSERTKVQVTDVLGLAV